MIHTAERAYKKISQHHLDNPQQTDEMIVEFFGRDGTTKRKKGAQQQYQNLFPAVMHHNGGSSP